MDKTHDDIVCVEAVAVLNAVEVAVVECSQIFREVAGEHAFYFSGLEPDALADAVRKWLTLDKAGQSPQSDTMPWLTWKQSTQNLLDVILGNQWYQQWMPDSIQRFWGSDSRLGSQVGKHVGRNIETTGQAGYLIFGPYMPLVAGHYQVVIRGALGKNGAAGARMDVVVDKSTLVVAESALHKSDMDGCLVSLQISLDAPCTDLEVRVWVEATSDVTISLLEIQPASEIENSLHLPLAEVVAIAPQHKESNLAAIKPKTSVLKIQALHQVPLTKNAKRKKRR